MNDDALNPSQSPIHAQSRIPSIDLIRGGVMIFMALDHVRVYSGLPAGGPTPELFFTRWITHFCAPVFIFLAGTSAYFYGRKHAGLSLFLLIRGVWLIFLEFTYLRLAWTFNLDFWHYEFAGVIWVIGCCMILMAALVKLPLVLVGTIGIVIMAGHNLVDPYLSTLTPTLAGGSFAGLWKILYFGLSAGPIRLGTDGPNLFILYSIIPWIGVMAVGYAFGQVLTFVPAKRNRICIATGLGAIGLFLVLRGFNLYGDPRPWSTATVVAKGLQSMPAYLAFLNTTKYPASINYLLMTLGPMIALIPLLDRAHGLLAQWIIVFGRVPFFFYLLHIPLIHALALVVSLVRFGELSPWLFTNHPAGNPRPPDGYAWSLLILYGVWLVAACMLYFPCRWYAGVKARRQDWWIKYL